MDTEINQMTLYHQTRVRVLHSILNSGLFPFVCYEWNGLYKGIVSENQPIIWFTDNIRPLGSYLHPSRCLIQVDSATLLPSKLFKVRCKGWWIYTGIIPPRDIKPVSWMLYRKQKPKFWSSYYNGY